MESGLILKLIPLISLVMYMILFIILLGSKKNRITQYYSYYIITMIIWNMGSFFMRINLFSNPGFWNKILCGGLVMMPIVFYHFTVRLTETKNKERIIAFGYITALIFICSNFLAELLITDVRMINGDMEYSVGKLASAMAAWSIGFLLLSLLTLLRRVKEGAISYEKVKYIIVGTIIVIIGGIINLNSKFGRYPFDIISNSVNALLIAYSIYKHRFLELKFIVKKGITFSIYKICISLIYILTILCVEHFVSGILGYSTFEGTVIIGIILAFVIQPVRNLIQNFIEKVFYKDRINHRSLMKDFSDIVKSEVGLDCIAKNLVLCITKGMNSKNELLFLKDQNGDFRCLYCREKDNRIFQRIYHKENPILRWFKTNNSIITIKELNSQPIFKALWSDEKAELMDENVKTIHPIKLRGELMGLLMLGEKKSQFPISSEEEEFLSTLLNNAAVAIDNAQMYENLKKQAITDGLTKLYNHRFFYEYLRGEKKRNPGRSFSVCMIDVDFFKLYNDLYGHSTGDKALKKIAEVIKESTGKNDIIVRYGGEEFAIIFHDMSKDEAFEASEKIRKNIQHCMDSSNDVNEFLTVSIGVANYPEDSTQHDKVVNLADKAMYTAKKMGKNKCVKYEKEDYMDAVNETSESNMQNGIRDVYFSAMYALAATIDAKDHYTYGHSENVSNYAVMLGKKVGLKEDRLEILERAGMLHDIGKIGIPESILTKQSALTDEEFDIMKKHVELSITIIKHVPTLIPVIPAILSHHEKYNGTGYPRRIKGKNIPIEGRILCIVDSFDAMTTDRSYRKALSIEEAVAELVRNKGTQFDPGLTDAFIELYECGELEILKGTEIH